MRVEHDAAFLADLERRCKALAARFTPENETAAWKTVLDRFQ
jgi:hypothetical protein